MSPRVTMLSVTPIKGFGMTCPPSIEVAQHGAVGNRAFFVVDARERVLSITETGAFAGLQATWEPEARELTLTDGDRVLASGTVERGEAITGRNPYRELHGYVALGPWAGALSAVAGKPVRLVETAEPGGATGAHPVTLLGDASVAELERQRSLAGVDRRRFRMLISFDGSPAHAEDEWRGRRARVGRAEIAVGGPVPRCAAIARRPDSGERDLPLLREIKSYRGLGQSQLGPAVNFGVYATVLIPGAIAVGDTLELV
jgi:uncharacterized protein YcbX